jgi:hypothetical protein
MNDTAVAAAPRTRNVAILLRTELPYEELLDAGEDIERVVTECAELDLSPAARRLLFALDDAIAASWSACDG